VILKVEPLREHFHRFVHVQPAVLGLVRMNDDLTPSQGMSSFPSPCPLHTAT
jgi:hypothetical protein